ncbi:MAG: DUF1735 domain-containing protein [Bacteroidetes bacterium]|nr:DUF1735 domain-containing protein [Bacteroidota bacterium]
MKKHFVKIIVAFVLPLLAISCIEDNVVELTDQGSTFISIYGGHEKKLFYNAFTDVRKVDLLNIRRNVPSEAVLQTSSTVKLKAAPELIEAYNKENGTAFEWLDSKIYTVANNPGVTVSGSEVTMNFGSGDFAKDLSINLDGAKWDLSKKYAVAYKITDAGSGKVSGDDYIITFISAKNKWDGIYDVTNSTMVDITNAAFTSAFTSGESYQYALETLSPTKCAVKDYSFGLDAPFFIFYTGSGLSYYGAFGLIVEFDPATDKIVAVTNYHGQPAPNTRSAALDPSGVNAYKNGTIDIKFNMLQPSVVKDPPNIRTTWTETWKYAKAR